MRRLPPIVCIAIQSLLLTTPSLSLIALELGDTRACKPHEVKVLAAGKSLRAGQLATIRRTLACI
jgi:hypothetical protein